MNFHDGDRVRSLDLDTQYLGTVVKPPKDYYRPSEREFAPRYIVFVHWDHFPEGKWAPEDTAHLEKVAA